MVVFCLSPQQKQRKAGLVIDESANSRHGPGCKAATMLGGAFVPLSLRSGSGKLAFRVLLLPGLYITGNHYIFLSQLLCYVIYCCRASSAAIISFLLRVGVYLMAEQHGITQLINWCHATKSSEAFVASVRYETGRTSNASLGTFSKQSCGGLSIFTHLHHQGQ